MIASKIIALKKEARVVVLLILLVAFHIDMFSFYLVFHTEKK